MIGRFIKLVSNCLYDHEHYNIDQPKKFKLYKKIFHNSILKVVSDVKGYRRLYCIKSEYQATNFSNVVSLVRDNIGLLVIRKKSEYILYGAFSANNDNLRVNLMTLAVIANPTCLNSVSFSVITSKIKNKNNLIVNLQYILENNHQINDYDRFIISSYLNYDVCKYYAEINVDKLTIGRKIYIASLTNDHSSIVKIFTDEKIALNSLDKRSINMIFMALLKENKTWEARELLESEIGSKIDNKQINDYWFSQADICNGYLSMLSRDMSNVCKKVFSENYIQSLHDINENEKLLVFCSWGPGDDIRYSTLFKIIYMQHKRVTFTCEPRLHSLFVKLYPYIDIVPCYRTKRLSFENAEYFNELSHPKLHHIMDNACASRVHNYDKVTLLTDLIPDILIDNTRLKVNETIKITCDSEVAKKIDFFINKLKLSGKKIVGLCWRSMIQRNSRNRHYFSVESLQNILERDDCIFVSLQYDDCKDELFLINTDFDSSIFSPPIDQLNDFESVLYLMQKLDVIVSAGTVVLELAGLSGTPTYALVNSKVQEYRIRDGIDFWFSNITYLPKATVMSKKELVEKISLSIGRIN